MSTDKDYYYQRAEAQLNLAQAATHPAVARSHFMLAEAYIELAYPDAPDGDQWVEEAEAVTT